MAFYQDINENNPTFKPLVKDSESVAQWIENLVMTSKGEILFNPTYGCDLPSFLFELIDAQNGILIFNAIQSEVERQDPEVTIVAESTTIIPDAENNAYYLNLAFQIKGLDGVIFKVPVVALR